MFAGMKAEQEREVPGEREYCLSCFDGYMGDGRKLATCYRHNITHDKLVGCPKCAVVVESVSPGRCVPPVIVDKAYDTKLTNPKDLIGSSKLPLHLWPETATLMGSLGLLDGMMKYGRANWRHTGVRASIYVDAVKRHVNAWFEGEDNDPDSGLPHMAHALACLAILVDAKVAGKLNDDRQTPGGYRALVTELTPHVERLKQMHKHRAPRHYTIEDKP